MESTKGYIKTGADKKPFEVSDAIRQALRDFDYVVNSSIRVILPSHGIHGLIFQLKEIDSKNDILNPRSMWAHFDCDCDTGETCILLSMGSSGYAQRIIKVCAIAVAKVFGETEFHYMDDNIGDEEYRSIKVRPTRD